MATLLTCRSLSKAFGMRELFAGLSISFADGERVGFLGPNGAGKSTLIKIMAGLEQPTDGDLEIRRSARIGYLPQEDRFEADANVESVLYEATADLHLQEHERDTQIRITLSKF